MRFVVYGEPVAKGRPRASSFRGHARMYTPSKTLSYEAKVKQAYIDSFGATSPSLKPFRASVWLYFGLSKSDYKKSGELGKHGLAKLSGEERCTKHNGDVDNCFKCVTDPLIGLAYVDDAQIVEAHIHKLWGETPRVEIELEEI